MQASKKENLKQAAKQLKIKFEEFLRKKDLEQLSEKRKFLEQTKQAMKKSEFWQDVQEAQSLSQEVKKIQDDYGILLDMQERLVDFFELVDISNDDKMIKEAEMELSELQEILKQIQKKFQQGYEKYDQANAVMQITAGAGGVDAQDWAEMLMKMYLKYAANQEIDTEIVSMSKGLEAGIKSVTMKFKGDRAYGLLKQEKGIHRLVRLSPFNANNLRQTSFASVEIIPEIAREEVEIKDKDLKIDTYRASGAGGQHVNTTDSAVRITHQPTNLVVTCQNQRSQLQNKETALEILRGKLYLLAQEKKQEHQAKLKGEQKKVEWGNQTRSYVLHPYKMVKDHRTGIKSAQVEAVLQGDLESLQKTMEKAQ
ncbi:MAG: peptide chain release factor 2 [Candidatus Moranbacteria bacterium]|nr:peptide chain release factor 2 [Candidatus Moranbacteria bacterium]